MVLLKLYLYGKDCKKRSVTKIESSEELFREEARFLRETNWVGALVYEIENGFFEKKLINNALVVRQLHLPFTLFHTFRNTSAN